MKPIFLNFYSQFFPFFSVLFLLSFPQNGQTYMVGNNPHHRREILDSEGKFQLEWVVDWTAKRVNFTVTVQTLGSVGFGLSADGKMTGADIVIGSVYHDGHSSLVDYHAIGNQMPVEDPSQDWTLHSGYLGTDFTRLTFSRAFDTCDPQDYPITEDKISLLWAYSEDKSPFSYHRRNRGEYPVYLLHPDYTPPIVHDVNVGASRAIQMHYDDHDHTSPSHKDLKVWSIHSRMVLPAQDTTYWCTMHKAPRLSKKHHVVGYEVRLPNEQSRLHAHHLTLYKCQTQVGGRSAAQLFDSYLGHRGQVCYSVKVPTGPMPTEYCSEFYQIWAVGGRPYFYPPHIGLPLGESPDEYYILQIHYDNPEKISNVEVDVIIDNYYTSELRPNDGSIMVVRHENPGLTPSFLIPPSSMDHQVLGLCGSGCTREILPREGIRINGLILHTHNVGSKIWFQHFRGNRELPWIESDDNYGFRYQQMRNLNKEVRVLPGDSLAVRCTYDNSRLNGTTVGGFSSQQEMCTVFFYYYNRINNYMQCSSQIESEEARKKFLGITGNITWSSQDLEYIVQQPDELAGLKVSEVSDYHVNWNSKRRADYQEFVLRKSQVNRCPRELYSLPAPANEVDVILRDVRYPYEARPYRPPQSCSLR